MIDTHAHLDIFDEVIARDKYKNSEQDNYNANVIIKNMENDNLQYIITIGTDVDSSEKSVELAKQNERIYAAIGIFPTFSTSYTDDDLIKIKKLAVNKKVVAIGEIGLDYHYTEYDEENDVVIEKFDKKTQRELLIKQLELANELNLPFCIHCRDAANDMYNVLSENKHLINNSGIMHCYSEGAEWFQKFLDLGLYLSFAGNITYSKSDRSFLKNIPLDRILVETDTPYLSPQGKRGRINEPKNVMITIQKIADEIGIEASKLDIITTENAKRVYKIVD